MTALPPQTDEQWANLRRRFPYLFHESIMVGNIVLSRSLVDDLRAAGLWCDVLPEPEWRVCSSMGKHHLERYDHLGHVLSRKSFNADTPHALAALQAAADVLNGGV